MANIILSNSPITAYNDTLYINDETFEPKLFFTDTYSSLYYMLLRKDDTQTTVISSGKLNGYNNGISYNYRYDFNNFIRIDNQLNPTFINVDELGSLKFNGNNSCMLSLLIDDVDLLQANKTSGKLQTKTNGEVILNPVNTTSQLVCNQMFEYKFWDKSKGLDILLQSNPQYERSSYFPITMYNGSVKYEFLSSTSTTAKLVTTQLLTKTNGYDYTVYLLRIPELCLRFVIQGFDTEGFPLFNSTNLTQCKESNNYFFWNKNGSFDVLHCSGNNNEVNVIKKNNLQIGNSTIITDIEIRKQIKQNSGLKLKQEQVYSLIASPKAITINDNTNGTTYNASI